MSELKPRVVCDLCRKGDGDNLCYAGGVDKCLKDGRYTKFELRRAQPANEPLTNTGGSFNGTGNVYNGTGPCSDAFDGTSGR